MLRDGIYRGVIQGEGTVSCVPQREKSSPPGQEKQEAQEKENTCFLESNKEVVFVKLEIDTEHISSLLHFSS